MQTIEHTIDIDAPPDAVWQVLTDVAAYVEWNPFMTINPPPTAVGDRLTVVIRPGRRKMTFRPTVTTFEPGSQISWIGRFLIRGLVDGAHTLAVERLPDGTTRFRQREDFRGVLVPLLGSMLRRTNEGFAAMNTALSARVTSQLSPRGF